MLGRLLSILLSLSVASKLLIFYIAPLSDTNIFFEMLLVVVGVFFYQREALKKKPQEEAPYIIKEGLKISVSYSFLNSVLSWFLYAFIIPSFLHIRLENRLAEALDSGWSAEQIEQWRENAEVLFSPFIYGSMTLMGFLAFSFFVAIFNGLILRFVPLFRRF